MAIDRAAERPTPRAPRVRIVAPATSANLGPGFDALGLALALANTCEVERAEDWRLTVTGEGAGALALDRANLIVRAARATARALGRGEAPPCALACANRIPLGRGLGSSAAAAVTGALAACWALDVEPDPQVLLAALLPLEGHPDNLAACLLGGLALACVREDQSVIARRLPLGYAGLLALVIPGFAVSTWDARQALPPTYERAAVVWNLQRQALLLAALAADEPAALGEALLDRLHEPYRAHLYPGLEEVRAAAASLGAAGVCVSGAGPTVLAFPSPGQDAEALAQALARAWEAALTDEAASGGVRGLALGIDLAGARIEALS